MGLEFEYINGQTPIDEDEKQDLLIKTVSTQAELNEFEQQNIEEAIQWVLGRRLNAETILKDSFVRNLHKRMFGKVWAWAGDYRKTNKNFGVDKWQIPTELKALCDDTLFWIKNKTFVPDEIAIRFKHRIVCIHCFPNGNGRHSRLMGDIIIEKVFKKDVFSWGAGNLVEKGDARNRYIHAVRKADNGDFSDLLDFSRS